MKRAHHPTTAEILRHRRAVATRDRQAVFFVGYLLGVVLCGLLLPFLPVVGEADLLVVTGLILCGLLSAGAIRAGLRYTAAEADLLP
jgi:hypothetical protein